MHRFQESVPHDNSTHHTKFDFFSIAASQKVFRFTGKLSDITDDPILLTQWKTELIGTGIVPTAVASYCRCIGEFSGMLLDEDGSVLWKGRSVRLATPVQWTALVIRDRGCVRCAAHVELCDAHHIIASGSPAKGETNIDNLVLLCSVGKTSRPL